LDSKRNTPPIAYAAHSGQFAAIIKLIELGAHINYVPFRYASPLISSVMNTNNWKEVLPYLMNKGFTFDCEYTCSYDTYKKGCSLLWKIGTEDNLESTFICLLKRNYPINTTLYMH